MCVYMCVCGSRGADRAIQIWHHWSRGDSLSRVDPTLSNTPSAKIHKNSLNWEDMEWCGQVWHSHKVILYLGIWVYSWSVWLWPSAADPWEVFGSRTWDQELVSVVLKKESCRWCHLAETQGLQQTLDPDRFSESWVIVNLCNLHTFRAGAGTRHQGCKKNMPCSSHAMAHVSKTKLWMKRDFKLKQVWLLRTGVPIPLPSCLSSVYPSSDPWILQPHSSPASPFPPQRSFPKEAFVTFLNGESLCPYVLRFFSCVVQC